MSIIFYQAFKKVSYSWSNSSLHPHQTSHDLVLISNQTHDPDCDICSGYNIFSCKLDTMVIDQSSLHWSHMFQLSLHIHHPWLWVWSNSLLALELKIKMIRIFSISETYEECFKWSSSFPYLHTVLVAKTTTITFWHEFNREKSVTKNWILIFLRKTILFCDFDEIFLLHTNRTIHK